MHTSCNFLSAILYHPSLSAFLIYHPDSGWHVTSSDQGLSFPEERAWERGCNGTRSSLAGFCALCTTYLFDLLSIDFSLEMSGNTIWKASRFSRIIKNTVDQVERGVGVNFFLHTTSSRPGSTRPNWNGDKYLETSS